MRRFDRKGKRRGQTMTEYIDIVALNAIASIAIVTIFSNQIRQLFSGSAQQLAGDTAAQPEDVTDGAEDAAKVKHLRDWKDGSSSGE
jgi:Flp pilus assembly pilin Flp